MLKLIKFEIMRKKMVFLIAGALTVLGQLFAMFQYYKLDETVRNYAGEEIFTIFMSFTIFGFGLLYFIDLILLIKDDLFKQEGYMLFMTPHNGYKILGSKLIFALLEGFVIAVVYLALAYLNVNMMGMGPIDFRMPEFDVAWIELIVKGLFLGVIMLIEFALTVYLSFALFKSLFTNARFKGLITFGIFIVINMVKGQIVELIGKVFGRSFESIHLNASGAMLEAANSAMTLGIGATLVSAIILFFATGYLLENRINL